MPPINSVFRTIIPILDQEQGRVILVLAGCPKDQKNNKWEDVVKAVCVAFEKAQEIFRFLGGAFDHRRGKYWAITAASPTGAVRRWVSASF